MSRLYPLLLSAEPHTALWGGSRLRTRYGKAGPGQLAETWELSVRDDCMSIIQNGPLAGQPLSAVTGESRFPLLVKFIDANLPLSVQVHPDDAYAAAHERDGGKTELWYIVEADPGARLILGLREGVTVGEFAAALRAGDPAPLLREVEVHAGESYFVPAGLLHAIGSPAGAGILLAEIQQNSALTYRVWDYARRDANGNLRQLHTDRALDVIHPYADAEIAALCFTRPCDLPGECICTAEYFAVSRLTGAADFTVTDRFVSLLCLDGESTLTCDGQRYTVRPGQSWYLPAGLGDCHIGGTATLLLSQAG
ncbi:MAG: class I mannose-6-phosphate isomerase [Clostridia bacterium]|nr:class I mannose-6-phosphate isomerase [Clostridia bacterium]